MPHFDDFIATAADALLSFSLLIRHIFDYAASLLRHAAGCARLMRAKILLIRFSLFRFAAISRYTRLREIDIFYAFIFAEAFASACLPPLLSICYAA